jgi:SNF2 family DNA or RNA helicase
VHSLYVAGSVEERVLALQQRKRWLSTTLLGDGADAASLGEADIEALFAPIEVPDGPASAPSVRAQRTRV